MSRRPGRTRTFLESCCSIKMLTDVFNRTLPSRDTGLEVRNPANILLTEFVHRQGSSKKFRALAGICLLFLMVGFGRGYAAANGNAAPGLGGAATESVADIAADFAATLPHVGGPAGYVGSKACRSCHEDQFASWHRSYHRMMTQIASTNSI